ncbi:MAG: shikimate kinase [Spirochaetales bacterium]
MALPIVIVGVKHTGKSVAATTVAKHFGRAVVDTDLLVQALDATESDMRRPVREIYRQDGAVRFHQLEAAALQLALSRDDAPVVATGGGICDNTRAIGLLLDQFIVHLIDSFDRIAARVFRSGIPAFLRATEIGKAKSEFYELFLKRNERYAQMATITVNLEGLDPQTAGEKICLTLEEHISGRQ